LKILKFNALNPIRFYEKNYPNTYIISKAMAEDLVYGYKDRLPIAIFRPSVVFTAESEPEVGFVQGLQGAVGVGVGAMTGVLRVAWGGDDVAAAIIPVDYVTNSIIATSYKRGTAEKINSDVMFINCAHSSKNFLTWGEVDRKILDIIKPAVCYETLLWYPSWYRTSSYPLYCLLFVLVQLLPAIFVDIVAFIAGKKPL